MNKEIIAYARISLLLFVYFLVAFTFSALTSVPSEGDSLAYHIPIAKEILDGSVLNPSHTGYALGFYPGSAEIILSFFLALHIPLNLYNVFSWLILTLLLVRLARSYNLNPNLSIIYAVSLSVVPAALRLVNNQTIDIWLAVFFTSSLLLLRHPVKSVRYFFLLGTALGFLIGAKFSGPFYAAVLLLCYGRPLLSKLRLSYILSFLIPILIFGFSWYIRNMFLTGNPLYPQAVFGLPGNERFVLMEWVGWKTLLYYPNGVVLMIWAFFSEYMLWLMAPVIGIWYLLSHKLFGKPIMAHLSVLLYVGLLNFMIFFFLPSTGNNIVTYLRYEFVAFIPLVLATFLILEQKQKLSYLIPLALVNSLLMMTFTAHRPKLFLVYLILAGIVLYKYDILVKYLAKK